MSESKESMCWDCPKRTGLSKLAGKMMIRITSHGNFSDEIKPRQRNDCSGPVPRVFEVAPGTVKFEVVGDTYMTVATQDTYYDTECAKEADQGQAIVPERVSLAMRANQLDHYVDRVVVVSTIPLEEHLGFMKKIQL